MEVIKTPAGLLYNGSTYPALVLDLDGTVRFSKGGGFIDSPADVALFPDVEAKLWKYRNNGYVIIGVSNQGGVAFGHKSAQSADAELDATAAAFTDNPFHFLIQCYHMEGGTEFPYNHRSLLRKPNIGMLAIAESDAFNAGYVIDWDESLFVGDRPEDQCCAHNANIAFHWAWDFFERPKPGDAHDL